MFTQYRGQALCWFSLDACQQGWIKVGANTDLSVLHRIHHVRCYQFAHCLIFSFFFFLWLHRAEKASYLSKKLCTFSDGCEDPAWQWSLGNISAHRDEVMISSSPEQGVMAQSCDSMNKGTSRLSFKTNSGYRKQFFREKNLICLLFYISALHKRYFSDTGEVMVNTLRVKQNKHKWV